MGSYDKCDNCGRFMKDSNRDICYRCREKSDRQQVSKAKQAKKFLEKFIDRRERADRW